MAQHIVKAVVEATAVLPVLEAAALPILVKPVLTEDLGKEFEMALCIAFNTPYVGPYKYTLDTHQKLQARLASLPLHFPGKYVHTAESGSPHDFTNNENAAEPKHLSAKTTKGTGMVAPQVIGQPSVEKFCTMVNVPFTTVPALKLYIQSNIMSLLPIFADHTFNSPIVYYNKKKNILKFIKIKTPLLWTDGNYSWTRPASEWINSSTLKLTRNEQKPQSILEIQFHMSGRSNMAIRWKFENVLHLFHDQFEIIDA